MLESVEELIQEQIEKTPDKEITTWHLRKIVFISLHRLEPLKHNRSDVEKWGGAYARRYGNPDNRISVILDDEESKYLTFSYLTDEFIPYLVSKVLDLGFEKLESELISNRDIERIAHEILSVVQFMHVYEINYETLYRIANDIALNPPHPWMVNRAFDASLIEYDMTRAAEHFKSMYSLFNDDNIPECRHKCMECLEHSCSALLGYYGIFMGTRPFHNLVRTLNLSKSNPLLWKQLMIRQFIGDLALSDVSLMNFQLLLGKANRLINAHHRDRLKQLIEIAGEIYKIISKVLVHRQKIETRISQINRLEELNTEDFKDTVVDIFTSIPNFRKQIDTNMGEVRGQWFCHDIHVGGILHRMEPRVLVVPICETKPSTADQLKEILEFFEKKRYLANTVFVASNNGFEEECEKLALSATKPNDINVILLYPQDLQKLYQAQNRINKLSELMLDFYDRI